MLTPRSSILPDEKRLEPEKLQSMSVDEQKAYLMGFYDLASIDTEVEELWYFILKDKSEKTAVYSLRTNKLLPFPGKGAWGYFLPLSGAETDKTSRVYMSLGGTETPDDVIDIDTFFILENDIIREVELRERHSILSAVIQYWIWESVRNLGIMWEGIGNRADGARRLIESFDEWRFHMGNSTKH